MTELRDPFDGKTAWITGASSGIGASLAQALAARCGRLVLSGRRVDALEKVRSECSGKAVIHLVPMDLTNGDEIAFASRAVLHEIGPIDLLVHCAGVSQRSLAADTVLSVDRRLMEVNFFGPVALTKSLLPSMIQRHSGHIVVISSLVGVLGTPMRSGYAASKHALHGFFDSLRAELHKDNIHVTLVCPGYVRTEITLRSLTGDGSEYGKIDHALTSGMPADKCAAAIVSGVVRREKEVFLGGHERYAVVLRRWFPNLFYSLVKHARIK